MSRVEEALRRASGQVVSAPQTNEAPFGLAAPQPLERYPLEARLGTSAASSENLSNVISAPRAGDLGQLAQIDGTMDGKLIVSAHIAALPTEQYRRLAATLHELQISTKLRTIAVSSAAPREGKTLTVSNLALTLSESYKRQVLLIDADLRRPSVHEVFKLPNRQGLSDAFRTDHGSPAVLQVSRHLTVLPAGQPNQNPMAVLTSKRMQSLIEEAVTRFDWVLIDTPPVGLLPDAQHLTRLADGILFVIAAGVTPFSLVQKSIDDIGRDRVIGAVLNRVDESVVSSGDYYHYYSGAAEERARS